MGIKTIKINNEETTEYVKQEPYVNDIGIYIPLQEYTPKSGAFINV